jgi:DNA invertase Pin-like site-specific DNA recombinase
LIELEKKLNFGFLICTVATMFSSFFQMFQSNSVNNEVNMGNDINMESNVDNSVNMNTHQINLSQMTYIYIRVSTQEQDYDAQRYSCVKFCEDNDVTDYEVVEEKCSAYKLKSQKELAGLLSKKDINIIVYAVDRLSRNVVKADSMTNLFELNNITIHSVKERISTFTAFGRHEFRKIISASQYESELISERVRNSIKYRKENGIAIGRPKYGYTRFNKRHVRDHNEQAIIRFIVTTCKKSMALNCLDYHLKRLLTALQRESDFVPILITEEDSNFEYNTLPQHGTVKVTYQLLSEVLNDYNIKRRNNKWNTASVGKVYKSEYTEVVSRIGNLRV